jgi:hypothetical protein
MPADHRQRPEHVIDADGIHAGRNQLGHRAPAEEAHTVPAPDGDHLGERARADLFDGTEAEEGRRVARDDVGPAADRSVRHECHVGTGFGGQPDLDAAAGERPDERRDLRRVEAVGEQGPAALAVLSPQRRGCQRGGLGPRRQFNVAEHGLHLEDHPDVCGQDRESIWEGGAPAATRLCEGQRRDGGNR